ncbi:hypothetical protein HYV70_04875 [Candidatus Uhrbacteria bacterium]|nr:hypothetical protein [Candidatus Uhrbacteria bacterium]
MLVRYNANIMEQHLKRVLNLVRRTGDTMVVVDKDSEDAFVVMDLDRYEHLLDETSFLEDDFDEDIDDSSERLVFSEDSEPEPSIWDVMQSADGEGQTWDLQDLSKEELSDLEKNYKEFADRHQTKTIPESEPQTKKEQEIVEKKNEEEYGEEQFYLEPIE